MRNCEGGGAKPPRKVARNSIEQSFNKVRKRCNSNDLNSRFEIVAGELRAKLGMASAMPQARAEHDTRSCGGAWPRCPWAAVGHGRGARGRRRGLAAVPVGGGGAWLRGPWAAAGPGRASRRRAEQHQRPGATGVEGTGETRGPGCGARGRQRSQARLVTAT